MPLAHELSAPYNGQVASIEVLNSRQLDRMRESCRFAAETLCMVGRNLTVGMTTEDIDVLVHEYIVSHGFHPSPLGYRGFPKSVCTSRNEVVCHGIPNKRERLKDGDIINVDVTTHIPEENGFHGDTSATFYIGTPSEEAKTLVEACRQSLERGIEAVKHGARLGDIGHAIQSFAEARGLSVVRDFIGHGVGRKFHMKPEVKHFGEPGTGRRIKKGWIFTIEPMLNLGTYEVEVLSDGWTAVSRDRRLSAQFEHTLLVTEAGAEVLTVRPEVLQGSEDVDWAQPGPLSSPAAFGAAVAV